MATQSALDTRNRLLASLSPDVAATLAPHLERVRSRLRDVFFDVNEPIDSVYFPEDMIGSIVAVMRDRSAIEMATIGREGVVGLPLFFGIDRMPAQAFCQVAGESMRMSAAAFGEALAQQADFREMVARFAQSLYVQIGQASACNRLHSAEQRCARWLLMTEDRVGRPQFALTHQILSQMLGVRRATVTEAAGALARAGYIEYSYGRITITNRAGLEGAACECYGIIRSETDRLIEHQRTPSPLDGVATASGGISIVGDAEPPTGEEEPR